MLLILLIILLVILVFAIVAFIIIYRSSNRQQYRNDVYFSGGANMDTGQISKDNNSFKGVSTELYDTVFIESPSVNREHRKNGISVIISNLNTSDVFQVIISDYLIFGRVRDEKTYCINNDNAISKNHCKLYVNTGHLYICDLGSSNHTYVNNKRINEAVLCKSGDLIKLGNTFIKIEMK